MALWAIPLVHPKEAIMQASNMEEAVTLDSLHMEDQHLEHHMDLHLLIAVMGSKYQVVLPQVAQEQALMVATLQVDLTGDPDPIHMVLHSKDNMVKGLLTSFNAPHDPVCLGSCCLALAAPGNLPPGVDPEAYNWFHTVDTDRSGYITLKELKQALVNSNWSAFNDETCIMMLNMFDRSNSGRIDLFGFSALWAYLQQWKNMFQQFDRDRSGSINQGELHQALSQMGYNLSPQFILQLMSRYSVRSATPGLQLDRFIQICTQLQSMTEAYRDKDTQRAGSVRLSYDDFLTMAVGRLL
ncbi:unnamed protein product [Ranitomeya imitator]|uniref:Peflin n=1 Tax=Ranitomeya imitator TaxID=111125 RepID=A0ABN9L2K2_9NEOB|nr:unnamed protein product [Ranitomeya imitator]